MADLPRYSCRRARSSPRINGRLDDPIWSAIEPTPPFVISDGSGPATRRTVARACRDDVNLYVAFDCADPDVWGTYRERDDPVYNEEVVEVFITTNAESLEVHYAFELSPRNILWDSRHVDLPGRPSRMERDWNCIGVETAVNVRGTLDDRSDVDDGWSAELAIPFRGLGVKPPVPGEVWRINFYRIDRTPVAEFSCWSPTLARPASFHIPERFGYLEFVE